MLQLEISIIMLKFTLVIPVFNEESHIKGCLNAVEKQTIMPDEVIIVDNNCTDKTIEIAKTYPFVRVIKETRQGRGWARSAGFEAAHGEIIGRIDADSRISSNWVESTLYEFNNDESIYGITGLGMTAFLPNMKNPKSTIISRGYYRFVHAGFNTITMWGANMAIRKSAWEQVKDEVCNDDRIVHEDQDLSLCMASSGLKIIQVNNLLITTDEDSYRFLPKSLYYYFLYLSTKRRHKMLGTFKSKKFIGLGRFKTFPGRIWGVLTALAMLLSAILLFPLDLFLILKKKLLK